MFKSIVDQVAQTSKSSLAFVEDKGLRGSFETVVDAQAEFAKTLYDTSLEISKQVIESAKSFDYTKFFAK